MTPETQAATPININLQITMANNRYCIFTQPVRVNTNDYWYETWISSITTSSFILTPVRSGSGTDTAYIYWKIEGYAA